ncbi:MAG: tetratricopeptide repeat protein [Aureispira sp.]
MNQQTLEQTIKTALEQKNKEELEALSKQAISNYPEQAFGYFHLAQSILMEYPAPYEKAEYCIAKASQLAPNNIDYLAQFASIKSLRGQEKEAQLFWGKILRMDPKHLDALIARGRHYMHKNADYKKAVETFSQAIHYHPNHVSSYFHRAGACIEMGESTQALVDYNQAIQLNDGVEDLDALQLKVQILKVVGTPEQLIATYKAILTLEQESPFYHQQLATLLAEQEQHQEATVHFERAVLLLSKPNINLIYAWGQSLFKSQQYPKALEAFDLYVQHSDSPRLGFLMQMKIRLQLEQYQKLIDLSAQAIAATKEPNEKDELMLLQAEAFIQLKKYRAASNILVPIPERSRIHEKDANFLLGTILFWIRKYPIAYDRLNNLALDGHERARIFVKKHLQDYVYPIQQETIEKNKSFFKKNTASAFVKKLKGKIWRFQDLISDDLSDLPEEYMNNIKESLSVTSMFITTKGLFLLSANGLILFTYKIIEETKKSCTIELFTLDQRGTPSKITLTLQEGGLLHVQLQEDQVYILKYNLLRAAESDIYQHISKLTTRKSLELLDEEALILAKNIWKN